MKNLKEKVIKELLRLSRSSNDTPFEPMRDIVVNSVGFFSDNAFELTAEKDLSFAAKAILSRSADPMKLFDFSDIAVLRSQFEQSASFLPRSPKTESIEIILKVSGRVYRVKRFGEKSSDGRAIIFLHGGGFVVGAESSNDPECAAITGKTGLPVYSVGYPLSPEVKFPAVQDATAEIVTDLCRMERLSSIVLGGESAGGNLALVLAATNTRLRRSVHGIFLVYPLLDWRLTSDSAHRFQKGYFLTKPLLEWFRSQHLPKGVGLDNPKASPLLLRPIPGMALHLESAEFDPLLSDATSLSEMYQESGESCVHFVSPGVVHGFLQWRGLTKHRVLAIERISRFCGVCLGGE